MITLTGLKRDAQKYTWELYLYSRDGNPVNNMPHKCMHIVRKVEKLQTSSMRFEGGSWLAFPKASQIKFEKYLHNDEDIVLKIDDGCGVILGYHLRLI